MKHRQARRDEMIFQNISESSFPRMIIKKIDSLRAFKINIVLQLNRESSCKRIFNMSRWKIMNDFGEMEMLSMSISKCENIYSLNSEYCKRSMKEWNMF